MTRKQIIWERLFQQIYFFKNSLRWNCVAMLKLRFKVWHLARKMIQILTCCKNSDSKIHKLCIVSLKPDLFWKSLFENCSFFQFLFSMPCFLGNHSIEKRLLLRFQIPTLHGKSIQNLTRSKCFFFDSKSDSFYKSLFKIWHFSKALVGKLFFHFFQQLLVFEKTHNCKIWRFHGVKWTKSGFLKAKLSLKFVFSQINFTWKPDPL